MKKLQKALLVEDNPAAVEIITTGLKQVGFEVIHEDTAGQAMHQFLIHKDKLRVIICDYDLKDSDLAVEDFIKIVRDLNFPGPIIAISGEPANNEKLMAAGATAQVIKPMFVVKLFEIFKS